MEAAASRILSDPERLSALDDSGLLNTPTEAVFDRLARLALALTGCDAAAIVLVAADREFFKSCVRGIDMAPTQGESPLSRSFCKYAVASKEPLLIEDTALDPRVCDSEPAREGIRSYAGVPLITAEGHALGTLCVYGGTPREWNSQDVEQLQDLASSVMSEIEVRLVLRRLAEAQEDEVTAERLRALRELATGLRHEINNALQSVVLYADQLRESPRLEETERHAAQIVQEAALRVADTLERMTRVETLQTQPYLGSDRMVDLSPQSDPTAQPDEGRGPPRS